MIYTVLDTETSGLIKNNKFPKVLEVGYMQINENLEILRGGSFYFYKPEWELSKDALAVNGLTKEFLEEHKDEYYGSLVRLWTLLIQGNIIGKNSDKFDIPVCRNMFSECPDMLALPAIRSSIDIQKVYGNVFKDEMQKQTGVRPNRSGKLEEYMPIVGVTKNQIKEDFEKLFPDETRCGAHGALYDAYMTYLVTVDAVKRGILKLGV